MGIRIHKTMGYGLSNLKFKKKEPWIIKDERINPEGMLGRNEDREEKYTVENYQKWLRKKLEKYGKDDWDFEQLGIHWELHSSTVKPLELYECFVHDGEYGLPKVINIVPYRCPQWKRYADDIDYYEEQTHFLSSRNCNRFKIFPEGFYPWVHFCDSRTGNYIKDDFACLYYRLTYNSKKSSTEDLESRNQFALLMGFKSLEECELYLRPAVPECIKLLCEFCEVFTSPEIVRELQPMMYVYWS